MFDVDIELAVNEGEDVGRETVLVEERGKGVVLVDNFCGGTGPGELCATATG